MERAFHPPGTVEERLDLLELHLEMLFDIMNLPSLDVGECRLRQYELTVEMEEIRDKMNTWAAGVHKNIIEFRKELYKRRPRRDGV